MTDIFPTIRALAALDKVTETRVCCPLCDWTLDVPGVPVSDQVGAAFGLTGDTLARVHAEQEAQRAEAAVSRHVAGHTPLEWLHILAASRQMLTAAIGVIR